MEKTKTEKTRNLTSKLSEPEKINTSGSLEKTDNELELENLIRNECVQLVNLDGDNQYNCDICEILHNEKKQDAIKIMEQTRVCTTLLEQLQSVLVKSLVVGVQRRGEDLINLSALLQGKYIFIRVGTVINGLMNCPSSIRSTSRDYY